MSTVDNWMKSKTVRYHIPCFSLQNNVTSKLSTNFNKPF